MSWNGIVLGKTTREDVEQQYGVGVPEKGDSRYVVEDVSTLIRYDEDDTVESIRVKPPTSMQERSVLAACTCCFEPVDDRDGSA